MSRVDEHAAALAGHWPLSLLILTLLLSACAGARESGALSPREPFTEIAPAAGIRFEHENGGSPPFNILQTLGSGCAFLDYDQDGRLDIFLMNSAGDRRVGRRSSRHALYRNSGDGRFTDVSAQAGFDADLYGIGCVAADYDADRYPDLLLTGFEGVALYRNNRDGTWTDVTSRSGIRERGWRTSAAFADVDGDGWLDLYIGGYLRFGPHSPQFCTVRGVRGQCPPRYYDGDPGHLYRSNGDGTFRDITQAARALAREGKTLGCLFLDYDADGLQDLYVANDGVANCLFRNLGQHGRGSSGNVRFRDVALERGVAYSSNGEPEASMGVDSADYDGDGRLDLFITNFQNETDALYRNSGAQGFEYLTRESGLAGTMPFLSFGCGFLDYDNDADPDIFIASGHVQDNIDQVDRACTFAQPRQLYENMDGRYRSAAAGPAFTTPTVGRGAAFGDFDNDGDVDIVVNNNNGPAMLLRNEVGSRQHWLRLRLEGRPPNRFAVGARVTLTIGRAIQVKEVRAGNSYASSSDPRLLFGLGSARRARLTVRWPDGGIRRLEIQEVDRELVVRQD